MTENDYYEASKVEFDMAIKSEAFGFNSNIYIRGITFEYHNKDYNDLSNEGKAKMDFHTQFLYDSSHNPATPFEHMNFFIHWMYEDKLFITDGIMYDNTDGCSKQ